MKEPTDITQRRQADRIVESLGMGRKGVKDLSALLDTAPSEISTALIEAAQRANMYHEMGRLNARAEETQGIKPSGCHNTLCRDTSTEHANTCGGGIDRAQGCTLRMRKEPPNFCFEETVDWVDAVNELRRLGKLPTGSLGHESGTDFAFLANSCLWWLYIQLLFERDYIPYQHENHPDKGCPTAAKRLFLEWCVRYLSEHMAGET